MKTGLYHIDDLTHLFVKRKKNILTIGLIILMLIIANGIYKNQNNNLESLKLQKDKELKKNHILNKITESEKWIQFYKNLLQKKDVSSVISTITTIAKESNVKVITIKPSAEQKLPAYFKDPFVLTLGADSYHAIAKFISATENHSNVFFVDVINIKLPREKRASNRELVQASNSEEGVKLTVNLTISLVVFNG